MAASTNNDPILTYHQRQGRMDHHRQKAAEAKFQILTLLRKLAVRERAATDFKRILALLSQHRIGCVRRVLAVCIRRGRGVRAIFETLHKCVLGIYKPKGGYSTEEIDVATLVLRLGGHRLAFALNKFDGLPSDSFLYQHAHLAVFRHEGHHEVQERQGER
jgi:hypothetical protein